MPLFPLGISRSRDVSRVPKQAAGAVDMRWSLSGELACALIGAPHRAIPPKLHAAALEAIHRRICVLPVQFGTAFHDETEIRAILESRGRELLENIERLEGTCEMALRIAPADRQDIETPAASSPAPKNNLWHSRPRLCGIAQDSRGRLSHKLQSDTRTPAKPISPLDYIEQRRLHYRHKDGDDEREREIVGRFIAGLNGCCRQWLKLPPSPAYPVRLAFLVERNCLTDFRRRLEQACETHREGRCAILGPWPPYSFAGSVAEGVQPNIA